MTHFYTAQKNTTALDILMFVGEALRMGDEAAVPAACLPAFTDDARRRPQQRGKTAQHFIFRRPTTVRPVCVFFERGFAIMLLVLLLPVFVALGLLIFVFDGAPVVFRQERYGYDGRRFTLFKFRTMVRQSEQLHAHLQCTLGEEGRLFKLECDPRVTRLGGFLRRSFLDELPQLFNVARGEMRLVGPRPLPASDQGHYVCPEQALRLKGLPGMTGLWQVSGRNARTFDEMCLLDTYYLGNQSMAFDVWVVGRTVRLVMQQIGLKRKAECGRE